MGKATDCMRKEEREEGTRQARRRRRKREKRERKGTPATAAAAAEQASHLCISSTQTIEGKEGTRHTYIYTNPKHF